MAAVRAEVWWVWIPVGAFEVAPRLVPGLPHSLVLGNRGGDAVGVQTAPQTVPPIPADIGAGSSTPAAAIPPVAAAVLPMAARTLVHREAVAVGYLAYRNSRRIPANPSIAASMYRVVRSDIQRRPMAVPIAAPMRA